VSCLKNRALALFFLLILRQIDFEYGIIKLKDVGGFIFDEFNKELNELNEIPKESYSYDETKTYDELNSNSEKKMPQKTRKVFASFMFACAAVAVLPLGVYVPVFSEIFSPTNVEAVGEKSHQYNVDVVSVTSESINCLITLNNVDFEKENYYVYVIKEADVSDSFLASVAESIKQSYRVKLTAALSNITFTKFMFSLGVEELKPATNYVLLIAQEDKIVCKKPISTEKLKYVKEVVIDTSIKDKTYKYLDVKAQPSDEFSDFTSFYFELYNKSTHTLNPDYYSLIPQENLTSSSARFAIKLTEPEYDYELRIYCSTSHPEKLNYSDSLVKDEITYYLIYTHESVIHF